jgi:hypothetical protein
MNFEDDFAVSGPNHELEIVRNARELEHFGRRSGVFCRWTSCEWG